MEIIDIKPRGFCKGVARAIIKARETRTAYPGIPVTILGSIVHNRHVVDMLAAEGIRTVTDAGRSRLELLDDVHEGVVVFSAHGVSDAVRQKARDKGLVIADATCEDVMNTAELIDSWRQEGGSVIYFGKQGHPESIGICEGRSRTYLVSRAEELEDLPDLSREKVLITNQTTLSLHDTEVLYQRALERLPHATLANEICSATRLRQEAVMNHPDLSVLIVVGDPTSNNTAMLARMGELAGIRQVIRIETAEDLEGIVFESSDRIGITSGASTPAEITEAVSASLRLQSERGHRPARQEAM